ncbi:MAG: phosphomevalonate kinase [Candidatus Aenigmarchaeota archaeon]|nr:phosphomevalonate kinase [Candidatus Aenigmarchaeota archaeon]
MIAVRAPGKLFIAGEWAVLEKGSPGIVAAVDKYVFAEIAKSGRIEVSVDDFGITGAVADFDGSELSWHGGLGKEQEDRLKFVRAAIEASLQYLGQHQPFQLRTYGKEMQQMVGGRKQKIGFGSSAASVVAIVTAILAFHGREIKTKGAKDTIFKLAAIAHYLAQGKSGSGFDIAASVYGGYFLYTRFDAEWLAGELATGGVKQVVDSAWPGLLVEKLEGLDGMQLLVCWTKEEADTRTMVQQMQAFKAANPTGYHGVISSIGACVAKLAESWQRENRQAITEQLRQNRRLLAELTAKSGVPIETGQLKALAEIAEQHGCAGKLSGAGGGDCGIAVCFDAPAAAAVTKGWKAAGLHPLKVSANQAGVAQV